MSTYCNVQDIAASAINGTSTVAKGASTCTDNCPYPFMLDSQAMYSNKPLTYCTVCGHHVQVINPSTGTANIAPPSSEVV